MHLKKCSIFPSKIEKQKLKYFPTERAWAQLQMLLKNRPFQQLALVKGIKEAYWKKPFGKRVKHSAVTKRASWGEPG